MQIGNFGRGGDILTHTLIVISTEAKRNGEIFGILDEISPLRQTAPVEMTITDNIFNFSALIKK